MTTAVTGVANNPKEDGSHSILINHNGEQIELVIPPHHLQQLIEAFQVDAIGRAYEMNRNLRTPMLKVIRVDIAHQGPTCELMVSTTQTGVVVLLMTDDLLHKMKRDVDRVLAYRGGSASRN
jgi:hypothetical protein